MQRELKMCECGEPTYEKECVLCRDDRTERRLVMNEQEAKSNEQSLPEIIEINGQRYKKM